MTCGTIVAYSLNFVVLMLRFLDSHWFSLVCSSALHFLGSVLRFVSFRRTLDSGNLFSCLQFSMAFRLLRPNYCLCLSSFRPCRVSVDHSRLWTWIALFCWSLHLCCSHYCFQVLASEQTSWKQAEVNLWASSNWEISPCCSTCSVANSAIAEASAASLV